MWNAECGALMSTPVTSANPYCTGTQFLEYYDARTVGQLLSDNDVPIGSLNDGTTNVNAAVVAASSRLVKFLGSASGRVEAAAFRGGRYTPEDLAGILTLGGNASNLLQELVANLTIGRLSRRRPDVQVMVMPQTNEAELFLAALEHGESIFPLDTVVQAGTLQETIDTASDVENRRLATVQAAPLFGRRGNRIGANVSGVGGSDGWW